MASFDPEGGTSIHTVNPLGFYSDHIEQERWRLPSRQAEFNELTGLDLMWIVMIKQGLETKAILRAES